MVTRIPQYGFSGGEIGPQLLGRTDIDKYTLSLRRVKNCLITKYGGVQNRAGTLFIGEVKNSAKQCRLLPFQFNVTGTQQAYIQEWAETIMRPIVDGGQILETAQNVGSVSTASQLVVTLNGHGWSDGDHVFCDDDIGGITTLHNRVAVISDKTANTFKLKDLYGTYISSTGLTYTSGGTISRLYQITTPYDDSEVFDIGYAQEADIAYLTHLNYTVRQLTRSAHASWTLGAVTFGPVLAAPTSPSATATVGAGATTYTYKISAFDEDTNEEGLPSSTASCTNDLTVSGNYNTVTWAAVSGAEQYIVYKNDNGVYGYIGGTTGTSFIDNNILADLGFTPQGSRNPFSSTSNYPAVCEFDRGRLWFGQTKNEPGGVWSSQSGNRYTNLNVSTPAKADDAVSFVLSPGVNAVRGLASANKLVIMSSNAEYTADGGGVQDAITPASLNVRCWSQRGSAALKPIVIGGVVLHVQRQGGAIRAFGYSFEKDGYRTNDLTLLAPHFFRGHSLVDWCYQQDPDSVVWCVRDDGVLLSLTFVEEQNTFAWAAHYLGGTFGSGASATGYGVVESCATIEGDEQDDVYLLVKRTINSTTKRYIEKLMPRWLATEDGDGNATNVEDMYFVDAGITFTSVSSTSTVTGLYHLEGLSVKALVDGDVQGPFTVSAGAITLSTALSANGTAQVGLSYTSDIVNLPLSDQTQTGAPQGRLKSVNAIVLKLQRTRGISYGSFTHQDRLKEIKNRDVEDWDDPIEPYTGDTKALILDGGWDLDGSVLIRQTYPLPMEISMIARDVTMGGP